MANITTVLGFDMETDIGSWTSNYNGFGPGSEKILEIKNYVRKDTNDIMRQKGYEITEAAKKLEEIYTELCKN